MKLNLTLRGWRLLALAGSIIVVGALIISARFSAREATQMTNAALLAPLPGNAITPADRQIQTAQQSIQRAPTQAKAYNQLAVAFLQKTRETNNAEFSARAEAALKRSLELDPKVEDSNFDALKLQTMLLLNQHRFSEALLHARRAVALRPQNYQVYGLLSDALVELGDYPAAVEAVDRMAALRPSAASHTRISYLRALHGHTEPALEAMRQALQMTLPADTEATAWTRVHIGQELARAGRWREAEHEIDIALEVLPDYHLALAAKGQARAALNDLPGAIHFYQRALAQSPAIDTAAALGDLYTKLGRTQEAQQQYALIETITRVNGGGEPHQLALFWADHNLKLDEALALAQQERKTRNDIYTCDLLAWCLYKKGQMAEARQAITEALRLGTRDARLYYHAGMIHHGAGDREQAVKYLKLALATNAAFDIQQAEVAKQTLKQLTD
jgi:tetratricopeptide (TPR) repeat protein